MIYQTINPATGEVIQTFPDISDTELEAAVSKADACYRNDWRHRSIADRARIVSAAAAILREKAEEYARYVTLEMGKLLSGALAEVRRSADILDYYAKNAEAFMEPKHFPGFPGAALVTRPIGAILAIEPWNFPYIQIARVAGPQLMAGNVVLLKHAESVPQSALAFARLFEEAGAPEGAYTNIFASHEQIARLIEDPRIAGVTVTGSERAGAAVAERAGRNLKKSVMELGGSDPFIVLPDAPLESAIDSAVFGRMFNSGQSCISSKRIIVVGKERGKAFIDGFTAKAKALKIGDPTEASTELAPLSSERAMERLLSQIEAARIGGATILEGGKRVDRPGFYVEPTVITDIDEKNPIYREELFGPVASIYVTDSEEDAIRIANDTPFGLGGSVFGTDLDHARNVADQIESGMVFVNQPTWSTAELPFGGVKNSGFGRELSELGFGEFVNRKLINLAPAGSPPWGPVDQYARSAPSTCQGRVSRMQATGDLSHQPRKLLIPQTQAKEANMPAYFVAELEITNQEAMEPYRAAIPATIAQYGGRFLTHGGATELIEGGPEPKRVFILEFADTAAFKRWYNSPEYQKILPGRLDNSTGRAFIVEGAS